MSDLEKERKRKNLIVFGMVIGFCALIFAIAMVRMSGA